MIAEAEEGSKVGAELRHPCGAAAQRRSLCNMPHLSRGACRWQRVISTSRLPASPARLKKTAGLATYGWTAGCFPLFDMHDRSIKVGGVEGDFASIVDMAEEKGEVGADARRKRGSDYSGGEVDDAALGLAARAIGVNAHGVGIDLEAKAGIKLDANLRRRLGVAVVAECAPHPQRCMRNAELWSAVVAIIYA